MAFQVRGKTALVTGGGSGICLEFAKLLHTNGCNVVVADLQLLPEAQEIIDATQGAKVRVVFHKADVTDWSQLQASFDRAINEFGQLDIVCPGAGIFEPYWSNFWHPQEGCDNISTSSYKTLDVNITHPIRATQMAIDIFKKLKHGRGAVVLISSIAAQMELVIAPLYAASKAAVSSFTRSMAPLEPVINIRINAVAPGIVKTPIWTADKLKLFNEKTDVWVTPKQIADVMLSLIQHDEYVGGTILEVGAESLRSVKINDPGPSGKGLSVGAVEIPVAETFAAIESNFGN